MIEQTLLSGVLYDEDFSRQVIPFLKEEYFRDDGQRITLKLIIQYINKYTSIPTKEALAIDLSKLMGLSQSEFDSAKTCIMNLERPDVEHDWLVDQAEVFCQDKALFGGLMEALSIADGNADGVSRGQIPKLLEEALAVSFDTSIGHDFIEDAEDRFDYYHTKGDKIKFMLESFNDCTRGGFERKTINIVLGGTNVGKSLVMCHLGADYVMGGSNVLYITMEMAEKKIAQRIDANLLDTAMDDLMELPKDAYLKKLQRVRDKQPGRLVIKEFPTASAHVGHFRHLLNELRIKKNFKPDVIIIDYLNICASSRVRSGANANSYTIVKSIAEELRGLFVEYNAVGITATQTNREGFDDSDVGLTSTSESFGVPMTADWMGAIVSNDELAALNQYLAIQLKSRYDDINRMRKFMIGVDRPKMRLFDVDSSVYSGGGNHGGGKPKDPDKNDRPLNTFGAADKIQKKAAEFDFN
jgi:archaellum biogenesis ATPase FlaH